MLDLGTVKPGTTLYIPWNTFSSDDPSASMTITGLATTDIEVYKNGSVTQRSSDAGYALLDTDGIDFDSTTGIHGISIDLADNTDSGFYVSGGQYWVVIASITLDAATVNFVAVTFRIGYPDALIDTTIATLASQTSFTLTAGPAEDDALNGMYCIIHDIASSVQMGYGIISDYTGATKTVTLAAGTTFTAAAGDNISIIAPMPLQPATAGRTLGVESDGDLTKVNTLDGHTAQTADHTAGIADIPTVAEFNARTVSATAAGNMEDTYDGTGYTDDAAPATQEQVGRLTAGSAAISTTAESFTKAGAEPETNTYTSTVEEDGTYHIVEDDVGATDCYYQFDVGGNGVPVSVTWIGYAQSQGDSYTIYAYNYGTTTYEQIGSKVGLPGTTAIERTFDLTNAHVGTGANLGKVRFRFLSADGTAFATDRLFCSYAVVTKSVGYALGAIWADTNASNTNTEDYVDGTADNPVSTWAAVLTISASMGIKKFILAANSSVTLTANSDNYEIIGYGATVTLNGQSVSGTRIVGATVVGNDDGSNATELILENCHIGGNTLGLTHALNCPVTGDITIAEAATYLFKDCYCAVDTPTTPPVFDVNAVAAHISVKNWNGKIQVANLTAVASYFTLAGRGRLIIASTCTGANGTISAAGNIKKVDNVVGTFSGTLNEDARIAVDQVNAECDTALTDYDPPTNAEMEARTIVAANYFDPATDTVALVTDITTKTGFSLSDAGADAVWARTGTILSISYDLMVERLYMERWHKEIITNSTGAVALRNAGDSADYATGSITDNSTLTTRTALTPV